MSEIHARAKLRLLAGDEFRVRACISLESPKFETILRQHRVKFTKDGYEITSFLLVLTLLASSLIIGHLFCKNSSPSQAMVST